MDKLRELLGKLGEASDADLAGALSEIAAKATELGAAELTDARLTEIEEYADAARQIRGEQTARTTKAAASGRAAAGLADMAGTEDDTGNDGDNAEGTDTTGNGDAAADPGAGDGDDNGTDTNENESNDSVTASGKAKLGTISGKTTAGKGSTPQAIAASVTVSGNVPGYTSGDTLTREKLAQAFSEKFASLNKTTTDGNFNVARVNYDYPADRKLDDTSWVANTRRIEATAKPEAIVAAGGLCGPLETIYTIDVLGVTARPVRDALNRFQVSRGGIQFRGMFDVLGGANPLGDGLGVWTQVDDESIGGGTPSAKGCYIADCPGVEDASVYSTYLCIEYPNMTTRFDPEWADATTAQAQVAHARWAENLLLRQLFAGSKKLTQTIEVSAVRDVLAALDRSIAYYRNRHRLDSNVPMTMIMPQWAKDMFRADLVKGFSYDLGSLAVADSVINSWFTARSISPVFHLDGLDAGAATPVNNPDGLTGVDVEKQFYDNAVADTEVPRFLGVIDALLYPTGDWLYLDGGTLDLGLVRDSTLNSRNRYQMFQENFEGTAFRGIESLFLSLDVCPTGSSVGTTAADCWDTGTFPPA